MEKIRVTLLSVRDMAQMLNRSEAAVRQMCWRRQIPYRKVQGRILFRRDEIEQLILQSPGVALSEVVKAGRG